MSKVKDRLRISRAVREKQVVIQGNIHKTVSRFISKNTAGQRDICIQSAERKKKFQPGIFSGEKLFRNRDKKFSRQTKTKGFNHH